MNALRTALLLGGAVVLQVIALLGLGIVNALLAPREPDDERDTAIERRSSRYSECILGGGVVMAIIAIVVQQVIWQGLLGALREALEDPQNNDAVQEALTKVSDLILLNPLVVGHFLLLCFVSSEIVRFATIAYGYRRGS